MKFGCNRIALVCAVGLISVTVVSARELTLDDCIAEALKNRSNIIAARGGEELARAGKRAALGAFLPTISASYEARTAKPFEEDTLIGQVTRNTTFHAITGAIEIANLYTTLANYSSARTDVLKAKLDVINSEQDMIYAVKLAYYDYLRSVEDVNVNTEAVKRSEEALKLIQSKFELGSAAKSDVLKQKVQFGNDRVEMLRSKNSVTTTKSDLAYTIGIDPSSDVEFSQAYTTRQFDGTLEEAIQFALQNEPGLRASEQDVKGRKIDYRAARSRYLPTIGGDFTVQESGPTGNFGDGPDKTISYGVRLSWTLFDGFQRERAVTYARVARNNATANLADERNAVISGVNSAYLNIGQLREQKAVSQENVDAATEDLKISQEKYNLGAATILDLLDSQVSLKRAQAQLIQADFNLNLAVAKLENAMGKM
ncbi:MAG: TolC family protein [Candidatus Zixiibacteriota bacterium]